MEVIVNSSWEIWLIWSRETQTWQQRRENISVSMIILSYNCRGLGRG